MILDLLNKWLWFFGLALAQVLLFDNMALPGQIAPLAYLYFLLRLNGQTSKVGLLLWAGLMGLTMDVFQNAPGVNTVATVSVAMLRIHFLYLFLPHSLQGVKLVVPCARMMGWGYFTKYVSMATLIHHCLLVVVDVESWNQPYWAIVRWLGCSLLTIGVAMLLEWMRK